MADFPKLLSEMRSRGLSLGAVESFTAGLFSSTVGEIPGASATFRGALVTYDPALKTKLAGVSEKTIREKGVVSPETAIEMAVGGRKVLGVDVCVSFTGDAGPGLEKGNSKVGEAYICIATGKQNIVLHPSFDGSRNAIRKAAVEMAADYLLSLLGKGTLGNF